MQRVTRSFIIQNGRRFALAINSGNKILISQIEKICGFFRFAFSPERVVTKNGICCGRLWPSRSDFKPAEHKKSSSAAAWIFCMEPNSFGVTRGEQPLVRASRASKVAGAFLVLFCARKRVHTRRRCILQKALNFKHATTLCARNLYFSTFRLCRVQNSFAGCKLRAGLCQRPGGGTGS